MKPRYQGGVVDERLNVYGVQGLKIAGMALIVLDLIASLFIITQRL